ncbi:MAG: hypothetical protein IJM92_06705 [Fibrobacter sp.]|uniref:hypothetical protein n=1 Tax=Fibrobacter sp. TaxID=35828 RepID=UPI0025C48979|nr:hypothetical protein [Fibrobacter sp.]MBQ7079343.1 hypothetical protein [Fibrobacter sp.]
MKKIYFSMMLAASMCFADVDIQAGHVYNIAGGGRFGISNYGNAALHGFKFYVYFNGPPVGNFNSDFSTEIKRYEPINQWSGNYVVDYGVMPKSITYKRLSATQYRAELDYSDIVIPANGGHFPTNGSLWVTFSSSDEYGMIEWAIYGGYSSYMAGSVLRGYVVESLSGEVLFSMDGTIPGREYVQIDNKRRIGVLTDESTCSDFYDYDPNSVAHEISLDVEDSNNQTSITHVGGAAGAPIGVKKAGSYLRFRYCGLYFSQLPQARFGYAVLKLDSECPAGSLPITRIHDTEDSANNDSYTGYIWPNTVVKGSTHARLQYCYVPSKAGSSIKYPFDKKYGVFASNRAYVGDESNISVSKVFVDDENNNNQNSWDRNGVPLHLRSSSQDVMTGYQDTEYYVARWVGPANATLAKSADVAQTDNIAVENTLVAATPLAPAVKGLNRNVVAVELKSAGDVKVSVVGVNGAVIASIAEKNLQPGVQQIKWNAGMVPSGRYIVKVEQNGMVNAKNVILK